MQLNALSLTVGSTQLLDNIDFELTAGDRMALLGPNGAGKSTLLKLLAGEHLHYQGDYWINGRRWGEWQREEIARIVGVLPQQTELAFPFTVEEVVALGRLPHSTGRKRDREIVSEALALVDMSAFAERLYPQLSGGEKQRVQLARVLTQIWEDTGLGTRYLLLDEPTSALDLAHQHMILQQAAELAGQGIALVAVLHDLNLAARYCDQVVLLDHGRVAANGSVEQIIQPERINPLFGIEIAVQSHPQLERPLIVTL